MRDIRPPIRTHSRSQPRPIPSRPVTYSVRRRTTTTITTTINDVIVAPQYTKTQTVTSTQTEIPKITPVVPAMQVPPSDEPPVSTHSKEMASSEDMSLQRLSFWQRLRAPKVRSLLGAGVVVVFIGVASYVVVDTWLTNNRVKAQLSTDTAMLVSDDPEKRQAAEGRDEQDLPSNFLANYKVAADLPRALYVDKLDIAARVLPMGVNPDGAMQAPINIFDSGWYSGSARPGTPGAAVIDAHASGPTRQGLFAYLNTLAAGDVVTIERGDGAKLSYKVVHTETVALDAVDMTKVLLPHGTATEGLNLITCDGQWLQSSGTYDKRTIVYTERML